MWVITLQELCGENVDNRSDFSKFIISWITPWKQGGVINEVQILRNFKESIAGYSVSDGTIAICGIQLPVIRESK